VAGDSRGRDENKKKRKDSRKMNTSGISYNGHNARANGTYPASIVARKLGVPSKVIAESAPSSEWHHSGTGSPRNPIREVPYYNLEKIREWLATDEGANALAAHKISTSIQRVAKVPFVMRAEKFIYHESNGLRRWHKMIEHELNNVLIKSNGGELCEIHTPSGSVLKKRLDGNWVRLEGATDRLTGDAATKAERAWKSAVTRRKNRDLKTQIEKAKQLSEIAARTIAENVQKIILTDTIIAWLSAGAQHPCPSAVLIAKKTSGLNWQKFTAAAQQSVLEK
jgi:hypothetical protein